MQIKVHIVNMFAMYLTMFSFPHLENYSSVSIWGTLLWEQQSNLGATEGPRAPKFVIVYPWPYRFSCISSLEQKRFRDKEVGIKAKQFEAFCSKGKFCFCFLICIFFTAHIQMKHWLGKSWSLGTDCLDWNYERPLKEIS